MSSWLGSTGIAIGAVAFAACGSSNLASGTAQVTPPPHGGRPIEINFSGDISGHWSQAATTLPTNCSSGAVSLSAGEANRFVLSVDGIIGRSHSFLDVGLSRYGGPGSYSIPAGTTAASPSSSGFQTSVYFTGGPDVNEIWGGGDGGTVNVYPDGRSGDLDVDLKSSRRSAHVHITGYWACGAPDLAAAYFRGFVTDFQLCVASWLDSAGTRTSSDVTAGVIGCEARFSDALPRIDFPTSAAADVASMRSQLTGSPTSQDLADNLRSIQLAIFKVATDLGVQDVLSNATPPTG